MAHAKTNRETLGRQQVDLSDPEDVRYWRQTFGVTEEELRAAVQKAGTSADKVRDALRSRTG